MKINHKITLLGICPVVVALAASLTTLLLQQRKLNRQVEVVVQQQTFSAAANVAQSAYRLYACAELQNQARLTHNLGVARGLLQQAGSIHFSTETVSWQAVNQFTKQSNAISLPKLLVGSNWLGQVALVSERALVVDDTTRLTRDFCTIFQRMNDAGDMLRVCTSVRKDDGTRAIGTFIPARNPDGTSNSVVATVLRGETYHGRAYVVNDWHEAAYEPIWDAGKQRIIGMLYIGIGLRTINQELHDAITKMVVGKTGYVFVLGGQGDERGKYLVSFKGQRDGENIWEEKDASGRAFVQGIIQKGLQTHGGAVEYESYSWRNAGDTAPRTKLVAVTCFEPWGWVIGAGAYTDDFADVVGHLKNAQQSILGWVFGVAGGVVLLAGIVGVLLSNGIARPMGRVIAGLRGNAMRITSAAGQISSSGHTMAEAAGKEAASLEEVSASLEKMAAVTKRNAESSQKVNDVAKGTREAAERGATDVQAMSQAMNAIQASSKDIGTIIETIDALAFQTNILALNAAVEAARAGETGAGFAVVADEVRSLAQRSAQAAKETSSRIEEAIARTGQGVELSAKVAAAFDNIVHHARQVDTLAAEVASASREQSQGIEHTNLALAQISQVTQLNVAHAEESAGAAKELHAQANEMKASVAQLLSLVEGKALPSEPEPPVAPATAVRKPSARAHKNTAPSNGRNHSSKVPQVQTVS